MKEMCRTYSVSKEDHSILIRALELEGYELKEHAPGGYHRISGKDDEVGVLFDTYIKVYSEQSKLIEFLENFNTQEVP